MQVNNIYNDNLEQQINETYILLNRIMKVAAIISLYTIIENKQQILFFIYQIWLNVRYLYTLIHCFMESIECENINIEDVKIESDTIIAPIEIKYEEKYWDKYKNLEENEISIERLNELKNSVIFENTPHGNVIMFYDNSRETFTYYSDNTIPYRFLETVSRKYVVINNCKKIYINMELEIKEAEKKMEEKKLKIEILKEEKLNQTGCEEENKKKSVFAKLKSYNKDTSLKSASIATDATKQSQSKNVNNDENKIVKENANRYSCEGKIANYNFLKKVDRKVVDKRYGITFAEFKKLQVK